MGNTNKIIIDKILARRESNSKDFPMVCSECQGHVWASKAIELHEITYCEECASKEPNEYDDQKAECIRDLRKAFRYEG